MIFNSTVLLYLTLSHSLSSSPLFATSGMNGPKSMSFEKFHLSHFSSSAFFMKYARGHFSLSDSLFEHFLDKVSTIETLTCSPIVGPNEWTGYRETGICSNFTNNIFRDSSSTTNGGVFALEGDGASAFFVLCQFINMQTNGLGGAIYVYCNNPVVGSDSVTLTSSTFSNCIISDQSTTTTLLRGGGVFLRTATLTLQNTTFTNCGIYHANQDCEGGAIYAEMHNIQDGLWYSTFTNCAAPYHGNAILTTGSRGGAVYLSFLSNALENPVSLNYISFNNCSANNGAAIYIAGAVALTVNLSDFDVSLLTAESLSSIIHLDATVPKSFQITSLGLNAATTFNGSFFYSEASPTTYLNSRINQGTLYYSNTLRPNNIFFFPAPNWEQYIFITRPYASLPAIPTMPPTPLVTPVPTTPPPSPTATALPLQTPAASPVATPSLVLPTATPLATATPAATPLPTATPVATQSPAPTQSPLPSATLPPPTATPQTGLSTGEIIVIIIACLIIILIVLLLIYFLVRSGRCYCMPVGRSTAGIGHRRRHMTYF